MSSITPLNVSKFGTQIRQQMKPQKQIAAFFKIVVPNFNNMPYIKKCLDSIVNQTFQDFILIIVDDISTDNSDKIAKIYANRYYSKIKYIQAPEKSYAGGCRNIGIDFKMQSMYTLFIDSDDWLHDENVLKNLYSEAKQHNFPKIIRAPMLHYYGDNNKLNFYDKFKSTDRLYMFLCGPGPGRTIVRSDICQHFVPNRAKCNDVVWFLRCIDKITAPSDVMNAKCIWYTYNRMSITSCQNNKEKSLEKKCIDDQLAVAEDLEKEKFESAYCNKIARSRITVVNQMFKQPQLNVRKCMKNAFFISIDKDRARRFKQIFKAAGFSTLPKLSRGCTQQDIPVTRRCAQSHINVVKYAKSHNLPFVMVFEDDAYPCIDAPSLFDKYLYAIPGNANLVLFGWCNCIKDGSQSFSKIFNRINTPTISGAHSYLLFESGYDDYLSYFENNIDGLADCNIFYSVPNSYVIDYPIFIQYSSSQSMNNHIGYIFYGDHDDPPKRFNPINLSAENK